VDRTHRTGSSEGERAAFELREAPKVYFEFRVKKMSDSAMDEATRHISDTTNENRGVSFEGKSLKLDTEDDGNY
jgi:hypothetical protein